MKIPGGSGRDFAATLCRVSLTIALAAMSCGLLAVRPPSAHGADDDAEAVAESLVPGVVVEYRAGTAHVRRIEDGLNASWPGEMPDERLPDGPFSARWAGFLRVLVPGEYAFQAHATGSSRLLINGRAVLETNPLADVPAVSKLISLEFGDIPFELEMAAAGPPSQMRLYWSGPDFPLEPIPSRYLLHETTVAPNMDYEQGRLLSHALRCGRCHEGLPGTDGAPGLVHIRDSLDPEWTIEWLSDGVTLNDPGRRMPHFAMTREDAASITAYLRENSQALEATSAVVAPPDGEAAVEQATDGARLVHTVGCLACHALDGLGRLDWFGGGDLSHIGDKRSWDYLRRWLTDPSNVDPAHRMPKIDLTAEEVEQVVAFLAGRKSKSSNEEHTPVRLDSRSIARGRELVREFRCLACHDLPSGESQRFNVPLSPALSVDRWGCLDADAASRFQPSYRLEQRDRQALRVFIRQRLSDSNVHPDSSAEPPRITLAKNNCLSCHPRENGAGLSQVVDRVIARRPDLAPLAPAMLPPSLNAVGDKLREDYLRLAVAGKQARQRPWLAVRMPRFSLSDETVEALARHFVDSDRIPIDGSENILSESAHLVAAGSRLVTSDGFGCTSCHAVGDVAPENVALNALGPNLALIGTRLRRSWFDRWLHDPARQVPRMEMPAVRAPVAGVLNGSLDLQRDALWTALNQPGFRPPRPFPLRLLRRRNQPDAVEPAAVLTDLIHVGSQSFIKPLVIGLRNRHNILLDLEQNRLAAWWVGNMASQHTQGKTWFWEAAGSQLLPVIEGSSDFVLLPDGQRFEPVRGGQFVTELDHYEETASGLRFQNRLRFETPGRPVEVIVIQEFKVPDSTLEGSGFERQLEIIGLPPGMEAAWRVLPIGECSLVGNRFVSGGHPVSVSFTNLGHGEITSRVDEFGVPWLIIASSPMGHSRFELTYSTDLPVDSVLTEEPPAVKAPSRNLKVVPGFVATQLPLDRAIMPTGFAWRDDGSLVITSLRGEVLLARDSDGDGLEDQTTIMADGLPTPYGVHAEMDFADVICKYGLVRLWDRDHDGRAERVELLASGWGHTDDYHDWAVGLPRDKEGNYYVALPCQQDDRLPAAARLRGCLIRLEPNESGRYSIQEVCAGLRFPMGLALDRVGNLFATDNQGNYNPFNELNHLRPGARYGFINKLEQRPGFSPAVTRPAIEIPHPWTRSVNGIHFLDTPQGMHEKLFGPFEGHLVGCEYDNRALVRMSLEEIDGELQGAVYPLSRPATSEDSLEGPVSCAVSPRGDIYVGNLRDSGWGAGANTGSVVRVRIAELPNGIAEVRARPRGFTLKFTRPVDRTLSRDPANYRVESFRRESTPAYGGDDLDRRVEQISSVAVSDDAKSVQLDLAGPREGFVYEFHLKSLAGDGRMFFPAEAFYTLSRIPRSE